MPMEDLPDCDYYAIVSRAEDRPRVGVWPIRLRDPLPNSVLNLRATFETSLATPDPLKAAVALIPRPPGAKPDAPVNITGTLAAPKLRCLVSSRETLHLYGEQEYPVPVLSSDDAIVLFAQRAAMIALAVIALASVGVYRASTSNNDLPAEYAMADTAIQSNLGE